MTKTPAYPGYATPAFTFVSDEVWGVTAQPWGEVVGRIRDQGPTGWTATQQGRYVGLFPDKQAAGEALVRHAGYEVLR